jgi:hypothetical protein
LEIRSKPRRAFQQVSISASQHFSKNDVLTC